MLRLYLDKSIFIMSEFSAEQRNDTDAIESFGLSLIERVKEFSQQSGLEPSFFTPGSMALTLEVGGELYERRLTRAIKFAAQKAGQTKERLRVIAIDGKEIGCGPPPEWRFKITRKSHLERLHVRADKRLFMRYDIDTRTWRVFSKDQNIAIIWTADAGGLPEWEDSFPLRDILHFSTIDSERFMAHAAAIGFKSRGVLLTGPGGSGKSTTTAAAILNSLSTAGDDFVLIDGTSRRIHALYDTVKLDDASLTRLPMYRDLVGNPVRAADQKARIHLSEAGTDSLARELELTAIMLPRISGAAKSSIQRAAKSEAARALVPSTVFLLRGGETATIKKATALVRECPTYRLELGKDPREAADLLKSFIESYAA
jgi:hypothetical protein